ncbi:MAG: hypothetical protein A2X18_10125 [Bacteroidetes bacterium GWF2_40_14]|nr:MAG: hypothetical protein A2X18_10125 [Bacteroidetes bacterium GWF2_40_14]
MKESANNNNKKVYRNLIKILKNSDIDSNTDSIYYKLITRLYSIISKEEPDYELLLKRIFKSIPQKKTGRNIFVRNRYFAYAASIAILLFAVFNYSENFKNIFYSAKTREVINKISEVPKRYKATLIINDSCSVRIEKDSVAYSGNKLDKSIVNIVAGLKISDRSEIQMHSLLIPKGGEFFLILPDGTEVHLNSNSKLKYPSKFSEDKREVYLEGEAFFCVSHSDGIPFLVITNKSITKVLGTEFNVKSDSLINQVTLCSGSVEIENLLAKTKIIIKPEEQATITNQKTDIEIVDSYEIRAWTEGKYYFREKTLKEITDKLNEWYDVDFQFKENRTKSILFTGMINRNNILNEIFELFETSYNLKFRVNDYGVLIIENPDNS